ncbi:hypothetical protein ACYSNM_10260, partial [Myroides sp. LJL116]
MKKRLLSVALLMGTSFVAQAQVGIGTATPNKSAELSVVANNRGLLIPNVALSDIKDAKTISNGNVESLLVFNTNNTPSKDATLSVTPGYYYWHIDRWQRMTSESDIPQIVVNQFENILSLDGDKVKNIIQGLFSETLTVVEYDPATGALKYIDELGKSTVIDIAGAVKNFETVTKIEGNKEDGTFTFIDEAGNSTTLNIGDYVKYHETLTTLVKQRPGLYTYTNEDGKTQDITVVSDLIQVIENKTDLDLYNVLKQLVKVEQSLTQLVYDKTTNKLTYIDESNKENELDIDTLVKANQNNVKVIAGTNITVTEDSSKKNLVTYTLDVPNATKDTPGVVKPGEGLNVDKDGSLNVDFSIAENQLANGSISSSSIDVIMDKGAILPTFSDVKLEIAAGKEGQVLTSTKNADGSTTTIWKEIPATDIATESTPGVVKPGDGLKVDVDGSLNVDLDYAKEGLAQGKVTSTSIKVVSDEENTTFADVSLEIKPSEKEGQILTTTGTGENAVVEWTDAPVTGIATETTPGVVKPGEGLSVDEHGSLDVNYPAVKDELAKGKVTSTSIKVVSDEENTTFADVSLEIKPSEKEGQILTTTGTGENAVVEWTDAPVTGIATETTPGVVKPGEGLSVDEHGSLDV